MHECTASSIRLKPKDVQKLLASPCPFPPTGGTQHPPNRFQHYHADGWRLCMTQTCPLELQLSHTTTPSIIPQSPSAETVPQLATSSVLLGSAARLGVQCAAKRVPKPTPSLMTRQRWLLLLLLLSLLPLLATSSISTSTTSTNNFFYVFYLRY